eukprot:812925-Amorphochlora_amoeboformis.AAC.1
MNFSSKRMITSCLDNVKPYHDPAFVSSTLKVFASRVLFPPWRSTIQAEKIGKCFVLGRESLCLLANTQTNHQMRRSRILAARKAAKKANLLTVRKANPKIIGNTAATTAPEAETLACDSKRAETEPQKENQNTSQGFQEKKDTSKATGPLHHKSKTSLVRRGLKRRFKKPHVVARSRVTISAGSTASISSNDETPRMIFRALYTKWFYPLHHTTASYTQYKLSYEFCQVSQETPQLGRRYPNQERQPLYTA